MSQDWRQHVSTEERSSEDYFTVTPSDVTNFVKPVRGVQVGVGGVVQMVRPDGVVVPWTVPSGVIIPAIAIRVNATGTTASLMVGCP